MPPERLSALDASFLAVESPSAHMHVGWAATFDAARGRPAPDFDDLFAHIAGRLGRAPRYRQRIAPDALGLNAPLWIDDRGLRPRPSTSTAPPPSDLPQLADAVLSEPLRRDRPLWELWIADRLRRRPHRARRQGAPLHGRRHRRGRARLAAARPRAAGAAADDDPTTGCPAPTPHALELLAARRLGPHARAARAAALPARARPLAARAAGARPAHAPARSRGAVLPVAPPSPLNEPGSPRRHLATARRPLDELRAIKQRARGHRQRRAARRGRRRAAPPRRARGRAPARPQGDGAGQRPRATTAASSATASRSCSSSCRATSPTRSCACELIGERDARAQGVRRARGRRRGAQGALLRAAARCSRRPRTRSPARASTTSSSRTSPARACRCTCSAAAFDEAYPVVPLVGAPRALGRA